MFQAQAVTLTVAQAFKVAFEFWQVSKEGESCLRTLWVGSGIEQTVEEGWQSAMGWGGEAKAQESGLTGSQLHHFPGLTLDRSLHLPESQCPHLKNWEQHPRVLVRVKGNLQFLSSLLETSCWPPESGLSLPPAQQLLGVERWGQGLPHTVLWFCREGEKRKSEPRRRGRPEWGPPRQCPRVEEP